MGLIKKYKTGNTMNSSFNNNDYLQRINLIAKADKNANGIDTYKSAQSSKSPSFEEMTDTGNKFDFTPKDYSSIQDKTNKSYSDTKNQVNALKSTVGTAVKTANTVKTAVDVIKAAKTASTAAKAASTVANTAGGAADAASALSSVADAGSTAASAGTSAASAASTGAKALTSIGKAIPIVNIAIAGNELAGIGKGMIAKNEYGEGKFASSSALNETLNMLSPSQGGMDSYSNSKANNESGAMQVGRVAASLLGIDNVAKIVTSATGNTDKKDGFWGFTNKLTGVANTHDRVDKEKAAIDAENKATEAKNKAAEDIAKRKNMDLYSSMKLFNSKSGTAYKNGGKLVPRFRRGGELDLEKENVILDGPSHDDHNRTGVKGDKGLPVVNKGTKVAEIESLELILNKNSSVKIEKLAKEYKKTGDTKILNKIGEVMKREINDNTYDYSKEIL